MEVHLDLAFAQGKWVQDENDNQWEVVNSAGERLWLLPATFNEHDVMSAIRMGREFELKAFNIGVEFGKEKAREAAEMQLNHLRSQLASCESMNEELSLHLEQHIAADRR